jgi:P pilus assembly chaperone PapD
MERKKCVVMVSLLCATLMSVGTRADGLGLSRTRIVMNAKDKGADITLRNEGDSVYLVQAAVVPADEQLLKGSGLSTPSAVETSLKAPFMVTPPLFRSEPHSQNVLRILPKGGVFPQDRESMMSFRFHAIPATGKKPGARSDEADAEKDDKGLGASLAIALGMTVKFIYRPSDLPFGVDKAPSRLTFKRQGGKVEITNPTPYFLTFATLAFGGKEVDLSKTSGMVAPFSHVLYPEEGAGREAQWSTINDYGGVTETSKAVIQ